MTTYSIIAILMIMAAFTIAGLMNIDWGKKGGL